MQKNGNLTRLHPCKPFVLSSGLLLGKSLYLIRIKYKKKNIFHPFVRTSSLLWKVTFASPFGEKSRPDTHKVWQKNPSFTLLCELVHYLGNFWSEFTFASPFGEKSRADSHKVEKTPSLTLLCELVHSLGDFLLKVTFASRFEEKSRPDSHKVEKTPSLTLLCELVHYFGDF